MIHLQILGGVELKDSGGRPVLPVLAQPKRLVLLGYLAMAGSGFRRRDTVVALFWPELDETHARGALRQAVSFLRRWLGEDVVVARGREELGINSALLECDATLFEQSVAAESDIAIDLFRGELLDGVFVSDAAAELERWIEDERVRLRRLAAVAAARLAAQCDAAGDFAGAERAARRALAIEPSDEVALRLLIVLLNERGDRAGALLTYRQFAQRLHEDYGASPAPETRALIDSVRTSPAEPADPMTARLRPVSPQNDPTPDVLRPEPVQLPAPRSARAARRWTIAAAVGGLSLLGLYLVSWRAAAPFSIGVLPLSIPRADSASAYLADGMTEAVIHSLSKASAIRVLAANTMFQYRGQDARAREVGRALRVRSVLVWRAEMLEDRLAIHAELINVADGRRLWGKRFDAQPSELIALQSAIAGEISSELRARLTDDDRQRIEARHTESPEAFRAYLKGRYYWNKRTEAGVKTAIGFFGEALEHDPLYALAYAGLANAYIILGHQSLLAPEDAYPKARAAALSALEIDSTVAEAYAALGVVRNRFEWKWGGKGGELERAIALNPSYATAYQWHAINLETIGRNAEAVQSVRRALELDPLSLMINTSLALRLYYSRRYDEAIELYQRALVLDPRFQEAHMGLGWAYVQRSQFKEAIAEFEIALALSNGRRGWEGLAYTYAVSGRRAEARQVLERLRAGAQQHYVSPAGLAEVHAALGEKDLAFQLLDQAYRRHADEIVLLRNNPRLDALRNDPRFAQLLQKVGLD
jgi:DNA-binding SARP family transcriptional activator/TolB-like protein